MFNNIFQHKSVRNFILTSSVLFVVIFLVEKINGRFWLNDFKVFFMAAQALLNNEQVYGVAFGLSTGFYKYSPFTLLLFAPFTFINYEAASIIYFFLVALCTVATIILLEHMFRKYLFVNNKNSFLILFSILLCVFNHLVRELHLGNTNMILLLLLSLSLYLTLESKPIPAGVLFAIAVLVKPYFIICLLPFLLHKKKKTIFSFAISLVLFVASSFIIIGFSKSAVLYSEWISAMKEHSSYLTSNHTIFSLLDYYFGFSIPPSYGIIVLGLTGILSLGYFWIVDSRQNVKTNSMSSQNRLLIIHFFLLIAIVPNLLVTDTEHFLFSLPLISILVLQLAGEKNYFLITLFILLIIMYGGNSSDIFGKHLAGKFEELGLLGISNLIIITAIIYLFAGNKNIRKFLNEEKINL